MRKILFVVLFTAICAHLTLSTPMAEARPRGQFVQIGDPADLRIGSGPVRETGDYSVYPSGQPIIVTRPLPVHVYPSSDRSRDRTLEPWVLPLMAVGFLGAEYAQFRHWDRKFDRAWKQHNQFYRPFGYRPPHRGWPHRW